MERLRDALRIPDYYSCSQKTKATGMEALMIMFRRLSYPNRWCDLVPVLGRTESELSLICTEVRLTVDIKCTLLSCMYVIINITI